MLCLVCVRGRITGTHPGDPSCKPPACCLLEQELPESGECCIVCCRHTAVAPSSHLTVLDPQAGAVQKFIASLTTAAVEALGKKLCARLHVYNPPRVPHCLTMVGG